MEKSKIDRINELARKSKSTGLNEAEKALEIAQEDVSTPIVAFRADAEKFRRFEESK